MNPVAVIHLVAAGLAVAAARPLIQGRVPRNDWYGIRTAAAFASEETWRELNRHGGRLVQVWGFTMAGVGVVGLLLPRSWWIAYDLAALVPIVGGLGLVVFKIRQKSSGRT